MSHDALTVLKETSRTFYIPISRLPKGLLEAVTSGYLCMRAIDEVEDDPNLPAEAKAQILTEISQVLQSGTAKFTNEDFNRAFGAYRDQLPEVSLRIGEWASYAPPSIGPRIWEATAAMSDRMAYWSLRNWEIQTEYDFDRYTFSVAGSVGLLLSDLWAWHDGTKTDRLEAIGFGRGLQSVNILRNHQEDLTRGVNFYPDGWTDEDVDRYARRNLALADAYTDSLPKGPAKDFCKLPLALAHATLDTMVDGHSKLSRLQVMALVAQVTGLKV
ncbi:phytoene/squalene synthase family protein [Romeriopsis navalis]|nr:phytoene/squalene synthase family protein [Romeriopsis navalis]